MGSITSAALRQLHGYEPSPNQPRRARARRAQVDFAEPRLCVTPSGKHAFILDDRVQRRKTKFISGRKQWSYARVVQVSNLRQSAVERLIAGRHNGPCDTDDGEIYYAALVRIHVMRYAAMEDDGRKPKPLNTYAWAQKHTPVLAEERPEAWFKSQENAIFAELAAKPATVPSGEEIAQDLGITHNEVMQFKLRSVGAIDRDRREKAVEKRLADAKRMQKEREKNGDVIPHSQSMAQMKPWEAYGISEPTFRRWVKAGKVPAHPSQRVARAKSRKA